MGAYRLLKQDRDGSWPRIRPGAKAEVLQKLAARDGRMPSGKSWKRQRWRKQQYFEAWSRDWVEVYLLEKPMKEIPELERGWKGWSTLG